MYEYLTFDERLEKRKIHGRVLETLEFVKIRDKVASHARTPYGRSLVADMLPCTDPEYVKANLEWTSEAITHIRRFGVLPLGGIRYLDEHLSYAKAGGTLVGHADDIAKQIEEATGIESRPTILGHLQRGGSPTLRDRATASLMGIRAIDCLKDRRFNRLIIEKDGKIGDIDIEEGLNMTKTITQDLIDNAKRLG